MTLHTRQVLAGLTLSGLGSGRGTVAPSQLVTARDTYARSSAGPEGSSSPAELGEGKRLLDCANAEFSKRGDTLAVRVYASIAGRMIELADARAGKRRLERESPGLRVAQAGPPSGDEPGAPAAPAGGPL